MRESLPPPSTNGERPDAVLSYPRFLWRMWRLAFSGSVLYYATMTLLSAVVLVAANAWAHQLSDGMVRTNMSDHVSWGLYIANFTFCVGLAAGAVMMVIPRIRGNEDHGAEQRHRGVVEDASRERQPPHPPQETRIAEHRIGALAVRTRRRKGLSHRRQLSK